jgi:type I restriction enzyme S subunit
MRKTPDKWNKVKLGDISEMCLGKMLDQEKNKGELQPYLANVNVRWGSFDFKDLNMMRFEQNEHDRYGLKFGDIVICEGGEAGRCAIWKNEIPNMKIQKALHRVRIKDGYDNQFVYYRFLLAGITGELEKYFTGSTIKHLTGYSLKQVAFAFPSLPIQQKIAAILSAYDDLIENNLKQIRLLEEMAQITYQEWFVRLKFPNHENTPIDETTGLPIGWEYRQIKDIGKIITGKTPSTENEDFYGTDIPFIKTPDMSGFPYVIETKQYLSLNGAGSQKNNIIPKNSLMVSCIATVGVYALCSQDSMTNQQINSIKFYDERYSFFMYSFSRNFKPLLEAIGSNGATMTNVNKSKFEQIKVVFPSDDILEKYHNKVKESFTVILNKQKQNQCLKEARDILLPRLMTGKITVE